MTSYKINIWLLGEQFNPDNLESNPLFKLPVAYSSSVYCKNHYTSDTVNSGYALIESGDRPVQWDELDEYIRELNKNSEFLEKEKIENIRILVEVFDNGQCSLELNKNELKRLNNLKADISFLCCQRNISKEISEKEMELRSTISLSGPDFMPDRLLRKIGNVIEFDETRNSQESINRNGEKVIYDGYATINFGSKLISWNKFMHTLKILQQNIQDIYENGIDNMNIYITCYDTPPILIKFRKEEINLLANMNVSIAFDAVAN